MHRGRDLRIHFQTCTNKKKSTIFFNVYRYIQPYYDIPLKKRKVHYLIIFFFSQTKDKT